MILQSSYQGSFINIIKKDLDKVFEDRRSTLMVLPSICRQVLNLVQSMPDCILAGGAPLELYTGDIKKIKDWDLFFSTSTGLSAVSKKLKNMDFIETGRSKWSITMEKSGVVVQLITKSFPVSIEDLFNHFDFSVCCFAVKGSDLYYTAEAAMDVELKQLNFIYTDNIITSIKRIARYGQKGYTPTTQCVKDLLSLCDQIPEEGSACS